MPLFGIDIARWNGELNFSAVKKAGVRFALVKASQGHALSSNYYLFEDPRFGEHVRGLAKAGIPAGAYHFFTASNEEETRREAEYFLSVCEPYRWMLSLYLACDAENYNNRWLQGLSRERLSALITLFCQIVEAAGYPACHYTNPDHLRNFIDPGKIPYPVWQAHYAKNGVTKRPEDVGDRLAIHQYTDSGMLPGVAGSFDLNFGYAPLCAMIIQSLTTIEDQTIAYILTHPTGDAILAKLADRMVMRDLKKFEDQSTAHLAEMIRWHCGLSESESAHLTAYRWVVPLYEKLYGAMCRS